MPILNEHREFYPVDMENDWHVPPAYPTGIEQKILSGGLDEGGRTGRRTRLLRFHPGAQTTQPFVHDYFEEVYLLAGDLIVGDEAAGGTAKIFTAGTYACRPPGIYHGPFRSAKGCLLLEIHYYRP